MKTWCVIAGLILCVTLSVSKGKSVSPELAAALQKLKEYQNQQELLEVEEKPDSKEDEQEDGTPISEFSDEELRKRLIVYLARIEARIEEKKLKAIGEIMEETNPDDIDENAAWKFVLGSLGDAKLDD